MAKKLPPKKASMKQGPKAAVPMSPSAPMAPMKKKPAAPAGGGMPPGLGAMLGA